MDRPRILRAWPRPAIAVLLVGFLVSSALALGVVDREEIALDFSGRDGLAVQSGHQETLDTVDDLQLFVEETRGTVHSLELVKKYGTFGGEVEYGLVSASASGSASDPDRTHLRFGDIVNLTLDDALTQVPEVDARALLDKVEENVSAIQVPPEGAPELLPEEEEEEEEDPDPEPEPDYDLFTFPPGSDEPVVTLIIWADEGRAQLIVTPGGDEGGINAVIEPGVSVQYAADGRILDLKVDNPVRAADIGPSAQSTPPLRFDCDTTGDCRSTKQSQSSLCDRPGACQPYTIAGSEDAPMHGSALRGPETLLHLWSNDYIDGSAHVALGDLEPITLPYAWWTGDPFTAEGVSLQAPDGDAQVTFKLQRPTADEHRLGFSLEGDAVSTFAPEGVGHAQDLDLIDVHVFLGPHDLGPSSAYPVLDLGSGLIAILYKESDGTLRATHISDLLSGEALITLTEDAAGDAVAHLAPLDATVTYAESEITTLHAALMSDLGTVSAAGEALTFQIADRATGTADAVVTIVRDATGCDLTPAGCLGILLAPAEEVLGGTPPMPPTGFLLGDEPMPDADSLSVYTNTLAGWTVGLVPAGEEQICVQDPAEPTGDQFRCTGLATAGGDALHAAAVGFLSERGADILAYLDESDPELLRLHLGDQEVVTLHGGSLSAAGLGADWGSGPMLTLTGPDGERITLEPTVAGPADLLDGVQDGLHLLGLGDGDQYLHPSASYGFDPYGDLRTITVYDPDDRDRHLFRYHDDGETTTVSTLLDGVASHRTAPSNLVTLAGNPFTASRTTIDLHMVTPKSGPGLFSEVELVRDGYGFGKETARATSAGATFAVLFRLVDGPSSDLRITAPGVALSAADGGLDGSGWTSGAYDNDYRVTTTKDAERPTRLDGVAAFDEAPEYGAAGSHRFPLAVSGVDADAWLYEGALAAPVMDGRPDGTMVHTALAWTERLGPIALVAWDDADGAYHRHLIDTTAPATTLTLDDTSETPLFEVGWSSDDDGDGAGLAGFDVQTARGDSGASGGWNDWITGMEPEAGTTRTFQGDAGDTYRFRARACDEVANCGAWSDVHTIRVAGPAQAPADDDDDDDAGRAPSLTVTAPEEGATLTGLHALAWSVSDPDGGEPVVNVAYRPEGDRTWTPIYSGADDGHRWDTAGLVDGGYTLRFTATDGARETTESRTVALANGVPAASIDDVRDSSLTGTARGNSDDPGADALHGKTGDDHEDDEDKDSPGVAVLPILLGLAGLALLVRRPRRG